jgi:hypothetical protein
MITSQKFFPECRQRGGGFETIWRAMAYAKRKAHAFAWVSYPQGESNNIPVSAEKPQSAKERGTFSGTVDAQLAEVLAAWPTLSTEQRQAVLDICRGACE